jgi:hypothetical protein
LVKPFAQIDAGRRRTPFDERAKSRQVSDWGVAAKAGIYLFAAQGNPDIIK